MKKLIVITVMMSIIFAGCSSVKKDGYNAAAGSASSSDSKQSQSVNISQDSQNTNSDSNAGLTQNIDTSKSQFEKGYYDYAGTIGNNMSIEMSIYPLKGDMTGTYFYDKERKEIKLEGKAGEKDIILYEYDETGKNTGIFKGTMNTVDKIEGTWTSADAKRSYPFVFTLKSILPGAEYGKRYAVALKNKSDKDVENFAGEIQSYVANDAKEQLAEKVVYPVNVKINDKTVKIQNKDDFIKNYDLIFHSKYKQALSSAYTKYLFANWKGIMFGENMYNVWINEVDTGTSGSKLMISAINN